MIIAKRGCVKMNIVADVPLKCRANERRAELVRVMPSAADIMQSPNVAHSPGQRPGETAEKHSHICGY